MIRLKAIHILARDMALDNLLYPVELLDLVSADQRIGMARGPRPTRAANTVHVILGDIGQIKINHLGQLLDIEATCRDIRRDQHTNLARLESSQGAGARTPDSCCREWRRH